jgi:hypothetical protein
MYCELQATCVSSLLLTSITQNFFEEITKTRTQHHEIAVNAACCLFISLLYNVIGTWGLRSVISIETYLADCRLADITRAYALPP